MNGFVSTAAITLRTISASLAMHVWPHSWCGLAEFRWSIDLSCEETAEVTYLVYTHLVRAATFKVMPPRPLPSQQHCMSALEACQGRLHCGVLLLFIQQIPHSTGHCVLLGKFLAISSSQTSTETEIAGRACSVQQLSERETSLPIQSFIQMSDPVTFLL